MSEVAIRIVGVSIQDDKLFFILVRNIGNSELDVGWKEDWVVCIQRADRSIVSPHVLSLSSTLGFTMEGSILYPNKVLKIYVDPCQVYLHKGPAKITVNGPKGLSASYVIEPFWESSQTQIYR
ncbi:hypothetical protein [Candidatus Methanodesulfokora washburnensis]|jgi:hypothetical protein|uniref:Uncharacterized protein n=1 Tax=Candidatus Methanodesulfokora washburnensis TaxID=2478471 RepID=A0A429GSQ3_9CREN|nr:hypothetical protein [Candidatus Methanodesulfokores washburnensis]RSN76870.1 hypothetical protein D6D85_03485 [Candidatus Methanodesulfokores washburnensis]